MEGLSHPPNTSSTSAATYKHAQTTQPPTQTQGSLSFGHKITSLLFRSNSLVEEIQNSEGGAVTLSV